MALLKGEKKFKPHPQNGTLAPNLGTSWRFFSFRLAPLSILNGDASPPPRPPWASLLGHHGSLSWIIQFLDLALRSSLTQAGVKDQQLAEHSRFHSNRPLPSSLMPLFQSESKRETTLMKMTLICMKMTLHAKLIFISKVSHLDSFWNRDTRELGNGLLHGSLVTWRNKPFGVLVLYCVWRMTIMTIGNGTSCTRIQLDWMEINFPLEDSCHCVYCLETILKSWHKGVYCLLEFLTSCKISQDKTWKQMCFFHYTAQFETKDP